MNKNLKKCMLSVAGILLLSGCAGYDRILFMTKTNVGLDIDDTPPTAEITIARRELAITPTYQNTISEENTLPLLGSFGLGGSMFNPQITSVFAGGDAAVLLLSEVTNNTNNTNNTNSPYNSDKPDKSLSPPICLKNDNDADSRPIDTRSPVKKFWHWIAGIDKDKVTQTRAFYFATDTAFGLKVAWNGTGGPYPTSLKLGYNRSEFAYPPVFITRNDGCIEDGGPNQWEVKVPSFFASLDNNSQFFGPFGDNNLGTTHVQFFATGAAAREWAKRASVKEATFKTMAPEAAKIESPKGAE